MSELPLPLPRLVLVEDNPGDVHLFRLALREAADDFLALGPVLKSLLEDRSPNG